MCNPCQGFTSFYGIAIYTYDASIPQRTAGIRTVVEFGPILNDINI